MSCRVVWFWIFFFKQKTAYELRISDWSSDVCSSDLSLGSTTALFFEPYLDAPDTSGLPSDEMVDQAAMLDDMLGADAAGLQLAVHAIGDKANATVLDMFTEVVRRNGPRDRRLRIEHAQHLRPEIGRAHV